MLSATPVELDHRAKHDVYLRYKHMFVFVYVLQVRSDPSAVTAQTDGMYRVTYFWRPDRDKQTNSHRTTSVSVSYR
jgi:hypothetical protein